jgi:hypothetical protein
LSKAEAEQLLEALQRAEDQVQNKVGKKKKAKVIRTEKDW